MGKYEDLLRKQRENELIRALEHFKRYEYSKAEPLFLKIYQYYKKNSELRKAYDVLHFLIEIMMLSERSGEAFDYIKNTYKYAKESKNEELKAVAASDMGKIYYDSGEIELSKKYLTEAYNSFKERDDYRNIMISIMHFGNLVDHEGDLEGAIKKFQEAEKIALEFRLESYLCSIYEKLASLYLTLNDGESFNKYYEKALEAINKVQNPREIARFLNNSIVFFQNLQDPEKEYQLLKDNLNHCKKYNLVGAEISVLINLSIYMEINEKFSEAKEYINQAIQLSEKNSLLKDKATILRRIGIICRKTKEYSKSYKYLKDSLNLARNLNDKFLIIGNHLSLGELNREQNDFFESYKNFTQALNFYRDLTDNITIGSLKDSFKKTYEYLPYIIKEINDILDSGEITPNFEELIDLENIFKKACKQGNTLFNNLIREECEKQIGKFKNIFYELKSQRLENDARELFRIRDFYTIDTTGLNWRIEPDEIKRLMDSGCQKNQTTKTIDIDIYGHKDVEGKRTYIIGECKILNKLISLSNIKCFILKANIIANHLMIDHLKKSQNKPLFHLVVVSLEGFPDKIDISGLIEENWDLAKGRLLNRTVEMISYNEFIIQLKINNFSASIYEKLREVQKINSN